MKNPVDWHMVMLLLLCQNINASLYWQNLVVKWKTLCLCKRWQQRLRSFVWRCLSFGDERINAFATVWAVCFRKARSFRLQCNPWLALTPHSLHLKQSHWCNFEQWLLAALKVFLLSATLLYAVDAHGWKECQPFQFITSYWQNSRRMSSQHWRIFLEFTWILCYEAWALFTNATTC